MMHAFPPLLAKEKETTVTEMTIFLDLLLYKARNDHRIILVVAKCAMLPFSVRCSYLDPFVECNGMSENTLPLLFVPPYQEPQSSQTPSLGETVHQTQS